MMLDKHKIRVIFFSLSSKWVIKQWRQLATPTTAFELLMNIQCSGGSRSLANKMRNAAASHWELTATS